MWLKNEKFKEEFWNVILFFLIQYSKTPTN